MGNFRIEIDAVGGHGCEREKKDGETVNGCNSTFCPDCLTREVLSYLKTKFHINGAKLIHWPGQPEEVVDTFTGFGPNDYLHRVRSGSF